VQTRCTYAKSLIPNFLRYTVGNVGYMSVSSKNSVRSMSSISGSEDSQLDNKGKKVNCLLTAPVERKKANSILGYFGSMTKGPSSNAEDVSISNITSIQDTINQKRKDALAIMGLSSKNNVGVPSHVQTRQRALIISALKEYETFGDYCEPMLDVLLRLDRSCITEKWRNLDNS
jgi:hypothetical protein